MGCRKLSYHNQEAPDKTEFLSWEIETKPDPGQKIRRTTYTFAFQGQERDDEALGDGNLYAFLMRMYDPRTGRFFSIDPLDKKYPYNSPYAFSENKVIRHVELEGAETDDNDYEFDPFSAFAQPTGYCETCVTVSDQEIIDYAYMIVDEFLDVADRTIASYERASGKDADMVDVARAYESAYHGLIQKYELENYVTAAELAMAVRNPTKLFKMLRKQVDELPGLANDIKKMATSRGARRQAMRDADIPTSQQPTSQSRNASGRSYEYETPRKNTVTEGGSTIQKKSVQQQTMDSSHEGQPHWEAGGVKTDDYGDTRMNEYGRPRLKSDKAKVEYDKKQ